MGVNKAEGRAAQHEATMASTPQILASAIEESVPFVSDCLKLEAV